MTKIDRKAFFDRVRDTLFGGSLTASQVAGMDGILDAAEAAGLGRGDEDFIAYPLATAYHETGKLMVPVREGFAKTNAGAIAAVTRLYRAGKIKVNYALPEANGNSYYGRGQVQLTWPDNYKKAGTWVGVDIYKDPDKMLDPVISAKVMIYGMKFGEFRGKRMDDYFSPGRLPDYFNARDIINGDKNKRMGHKATGIHIGTAIANAAYRFAGALNFIG